MFFVLLNENFQQFHIYNELLRKFVAINQDNTLFKFVMTMANMNKQDNDIQMCIIKHKIILKIKTKVNKLFKFQWSKEFKLIKF